MSVRLSRICVFKAEAADGRDQRIFLTFCPTAGKLVVSESI